MPDDPKEKEIAELKQEIARLKQVKSDFITNVSHELRTPLAMLQGAASNLLDGVAGEMTDKQVECLGIIEESLKRLTNLIEKLLDLSRFEHGKTILNRSLVDLEELIGDSLLLCSAKAVGKKISFIKRIPKTLPKISVDPDRMIEVLMNLILNAVKFTNPGGEIAVSAEETPDGQIKISVKDNGIGIAKERLPELFGKFVQIGREYGPGEKGTGLGLAICKEIVELHRGEIHIESELGKGTEVYFFLPVTSP
jgi:signal transduction histidine kinase